jgi:hypothetical protein
MIVTTGKYLQIRSIEGLVDLMSVYGGIDHHTSLIRDVIEIWFAPNKKISYRSNYQLCLNITLQIIPGGNK